MLGIGTARSYLIRIFSKTGTNQQSELVSLLKSISPTDSKPHHARRIELAGKENEAPAKERDKRFIP